jgi:hypothetical protein
MGEAKRRRQTGSTTKKAPRIEIMDPTDHPHRPGTLTIQILQDSGASLSGSMPLDDVDTAIRVADDVAKQLPGLRADARKEARSWIDSILQKGEHLRDERTGNSLIATALWLAWTAPEPQGALMRER